MHMTLEYVDYKHKAAEDRPESRKKERYGRKGR
jgi:hypothetical protein